MCNKVYNLITINTSLIHAKLLLVIDEIILYRSVISFYIIIYVVTMKYVCFYNKKSKKIMRRILHFPISF